MRARFIKEGERERVMVRTNNTAAVCKIAETLKSAEFIEVGFVRFWVHVVFPKKITVAKKPKI